jgi:hypothetical protein
MTDRLPRGIAVRDIISKVFPSNRPRDYALLRFLIRANGGKAMESRAESYVILSPSARHKIVFDVSETARGIDFGAELPQTSGGAVPSASRFRPHRKRPQDLGTLCFPHNRRLFAKSRPRGSGNAAMASRPMRSRRRN